MQLSSFDTLAQVYAS